MKQESIIDRLKLPITEGKVIPTNTYYLKFGKENFQSFQQIEEYLEKHFGGLVSKDKVIDYIDENETDEGLGGFRAEPNIQTAPFKKWLEGE